MAYYLLANVYYVTDKLDEAMTSAKQIKTVGYQMLAKDIIGGLVYTILHSYLLCAMPQSIASIKVSPTDFLTALVHGSMWFCIWDVLALYLSI